MRKKKKAYISGRISSQPWEEVKKSFAFGCKYAEAAGYEAVSPLAGEKGESWQWQDYMLDDLKKLSECSRMFSDYQKKLTVYRNRNTSDVEYDKKTSDKQIAHQQEILGNIDSSMRGNFRILAKYFQSDKASLEQGLTEKIALAMSRLGVERAFVVSGKDNMDEITTTTETVISEIKDGKVNTFTITPEQFGLKRASLEELRGGDGTENAVITKKILSGEEKGAKRDIVLLNAGATLYVGGAASTIEDGIALAKEAIDSGKAAGKLAELVKVSNEATSSQLTQ